MTTQGINDSNPALCDAIARRIAESPQHRITFAEYMELVLYHPQHGYYATNAVKIGSSGDFFTSPHLGNDFGELLAEQFAQMWEILQKPELFTLVEMGAGQGILAADVLRYIQAHYPDFFKTLDYTIVEKSTALRKEQQQRLQGLPLRWCNMEEIPPASITGCCFSNELVDALPVHQITLHQGQLQEIYVTTPGGQGNTHSASPHLSNTLSERKFVEVIGEPSTPQLAKYFDLVGINLAQSEYRDLYRSEVNLAALDWLSTVAEWLRRGYLLTIDYGYPASRYYSPTRSGGTLQCYYRHQHHDNPYINIGRQDITAHVDFTALERWGEICGLHQLGFTQQGLFLMALGLGERIAALSTDGQAIVEAQGLRVLLQRRQALHQLIDPMGLGGFGVLVQSKGLTEDETTKLLKGLILQY